MKIAADSVLFKILSVFGVGLAVFFGFVNGGSGGILISKGFGFNGAVTIISAIAWFAVAVFIYNNYQKKTAPKPEDLDA